MLASCALVLLMTPGLAFFYGGMVRSKSVLNMLMMSFSAIGPRWASCGCFTVTQRLSAMTSSATASGGLLGDPSQYWGLKGLIGGALSAA